jgi:quercetin dioxygenase-like cupin family protein
MRRAFILVAAVLVGGAALAVSAAQSQQTGIMRTELLRHDLSVSGRELIQVRVDFAPGLGFPPHSHPGEEIATVLEASWNTSSRGGRR